MSANFCSNCGSSLQSEVKFCSNCGQAIDSTQPQVAPSARTHNSKEPSAYEEKANQNSPYYSTIGDDSQTTKECPDCGTTVENWASVCTSCYYEFGSQGLFSYFLKCLFGNYVNFSGRARRKEFWGFALFQFITVAVVGLILLVLSQNVKFFGDLSYFVYNLCYSLKIYFSQPWDTIPFFVVSLALIVPYYAVTVRRLHDIGKSGGHAVFLAVLSVLWLCEIPPILKVIIFLIQICYFFLLAKKGDESENKYGPDPISTSKGS